MNAKLALLPAALCAAALDAGPLPPIAFLSIGYREATAADFAGTPQASVRSADPQAFLSVTADFNGDGKPDEARILLNDEHKIAYVVAVIQTDKVDTFVLNQTPLSDAADIGLTAAKPIDGHRTGLMIFSLNGGQGHTNYFDGEEFSRRLPISVRAHLDQRTPKR